MSEIEILDTKKAGIELLNPLETFILIEGTKHYYISSEGRLANDTKGKIYIHKNTISKSVGKVHWKIFFEDYDGSTYSKDLYADYLVATTFLKKVPGKDRIYHIDGDNANSKYNNLIYVSNKEMNDLITGKITVEDLNRIQEYIPFLNSNIVKARRLWNDMYTRCYNRELHKRFPQYKDCKICDYWLEDKKNFYKWVEENYYMVGNEQMDLDKDILCKGNKVYSPETCIFVPHKINTLFINGKKKRGKYPIGVCAHKNKYRAELKIDNVQIKLKSYDTPEEAFLEYKKHKEALIMITADKYKNKIPNKLYEAMLNWKIEIDD